MRIRTAIFGVYVAACAVGFAVLMWFMLAEVRPRYVSAVQANLRDAAHSIALALAGRTEEQAVAALAGQPSYQVRLVAADGTLLFASREPDLTAENPSGEEIYADASTRGVAKRMGDRLLDGGPPPDDLEVSTMAPFQLADGRTVRLVLSRSFRSVNAVVWAERKKLAGISLVVAAVMVVAGWWIAAKLTESLERLTRHAQAVRDGKPSQPPVSQAREIAELGKAFEEMRDALEGRQHAERYTQALAHEVKAPLAAIRGAAELMDESMPEEQRRKFLGNIRSEAARIEKIVERLLELSSLEARKTLQQAERIEVTQLMTEAAEVLSPACAAAQVTLTVRTVDTTLHGERVLLREALVNLLQNALDFSPVGGGVVLQARVDEGRLEFTVEDDGPGVPDYAVARVFERFYSLPRPDTARKSTGLGLALVREIAHLHGGDATLENRSEGGARARLWMAGG
ncbi:MAG: ATP-binding protein [Candidatus Didemnitutus sp.]|nr:ATP-binding protein [Candidatus Didemnitutus sp.]